MIIHELFLRAFGCAVFSFENEDSETTFVAEARVLWKMFVLKISEVGDGNFVMSCGISFIFLV